MDKYLEDITYLKKVIESNSIKMDKMIDLRDSIKTREYEINEEKRSVDFDKGYIQDLNMNIRINKFGVFICILVLIGGLYVLSNGSLSFGVFSSLIGIIGLLINLSNIKVLRKERSTRLEHIEKFDYIEYENSLKEINKLKKENININEDISALDSYISYAKVLLEVIDISRKEKIEDIIKRSNLDQMLNEEYENKEFMPVPEEPKLTREYKL